MVGAIKEVGFIVGVWLVGEAVATHVPQKMGQSDPYSIHTKFLKRPISEAPFLSETSLSHMGLSGVSQHGAADGAGVGGAVDGAGVSGARQP